MRVALRLLTVAAAVVVLAVLALRPHQATSATGAIGSLVRVPNSPVTLVCPAAPQADPLPAGTDPQFAGQATAQAHTQAVSYARTGLAEEADGLQLRTLPVTGEPQRTDGTRHRNLQTAQTDTADAVAVRATPAGDPAAGSTAVTTSLADGGDLAGLAVAACGPALEQGWLVGGGVGAGHTSRVLLSNPARTPVTVRLSVLTDRGLVEPPQARNLTVAPQSTRGLPLGALAPEAQLTAVGFQAERGTIGAVLVDSQLQGLVPRGVDYVQPAEPAEELVLTPVTGPATLRLANPGTHPLSARWRVGTGRGPGEWVEPVTVPAGGVVDVPVEEGGPLSLTVVADRPVLAAASWTRERPGPDPNVPAADLAWTAAPTVLTGRGQLALPEAGTDLHLAAGQQPTSLSVRQIDADGTPIGSDQPVSLPEGAIEVVTLDPDAVAVRLEVTHGSAYAGLAVSSGPDGAFVSATAVPAPAQTQELTSVVIGSRPR